MEVGTKDMLVHSSFEAILAVIAPANDYFPKWLCIRTKVSAPAMIFVTHQHFFPCLLKIALERHVGHKTRASTFGIEIEQTYSFKFRSLKRLIVVSKKLETGTNAQEYCI